MDATDRQAIPVVRDADEMTAIIEALDAALAAHRDLTAHMTKLGEHGGVGARVSFMGDRHPLAEHAIRLWASTHVGEVTLKEMTIDYDEGFSIRSVAVSIGGENIAWVQWPSEKLAPVALDADWSGAQVVRS